MKGVSIRFILFFFSLIPNLLTVQSFVICNTLLKYTLFLYLVIPWVFELFFKLIKFVRIIVEILP